jgi:hypothetical protein
VPGSFLLVAAVAAVLTPREVVFVETASAGVVRRVELPGEGLDAFAAPDGRIVVPLAGDAGTAVVAASGTVERWPGRVFPLFFVEPDRMYVVLPGLLATLSYPERAPIARMPLAGVAGARRAACSADGRLVAVIPVDPGGHALVLVPALERGAPVRVELGGEPSLVTLAADGAFAVAVSGGRSLELTAAGGERRARDVLALDGAVRSVCPGVEGRGILVGLAGRAGGELVGVRVEPGAAEPLRVTFRTVLAAPVNAIGTAAGEIIALAGEDLVVLSHNGRHPRRVMAVAGATGLAVVPAQPQSTVPAWSDAAAP